MCAHPIITVGLSSIIGVATFTVGDSDIIKECFCLNGIGVIQLVTNKVQKVQGESMGVEQAPKKLGTNFNRCIQMRLNTRLYPPLLFYPSPG